MKQLEKNNYYVLHLFNEESFRRWRAESTVYGHPKPDGKPKYILIQKVMNEDNTESVGVVYGVSRRAEIMRLVGEDRPLWDYTKNDTQVWLDNKPYTFDEYVKLKNDKTKWETLAEVYPTIQSEKEMPTKSEVIKALRNYADLLEAKEESETYRLVKFVETYKTEGE